MTGSLLFNVITFAYGGLLAQTVAIAPRRKESYDMGVGHTPLSNLFLSGLHSYGGGK